MKTLLERYLPLRNADGAGAGGGAGAAAAGAAGGGNAAGAGDGAAAAAAAAASGGSGDAAAAAAAAAAAGPGPYRPDGLAETMYGKDDRETIDKLHKAVNGYRERDATRVVPDKPEAYREFGDMKEVPDALKPHLEGLAKDPLFDAVSKVAMEEKIPVATMHKLTTALYAQALDAGILEAAVDPAAERAALLPEAAKTLPKDKQDAAIDARLQANEDFVNLMVGQGLSKEVADHGLMMLMDTAKGNQLIEFFAGKLTGDGRAQPFAGTGSSPAGQDKREALKARMAAPEMQVGHRNFSREAYDQLMEEYRKLPS